MRGAAWPVLWLTAACVACLAPFLNKAFHIDDTLFLYAARHIQTNPLDFYGFRVNWYGMDMPMGGEIDELGRPVEGVMQNPPLACYYIALAAALLGWSEAALHLAFLLPAVAAIWGTYRLAQQLCTRPALAALATLLTPAFLVSSTNVMCDTLTLALWVWTVVFWERGLRRSQIGLLLLAGVLLSLATLSKYIGVALIPLLVAYTVAYQWKAGGQKGDCPSKTKGKSLFFPWLTATLTPCLPLAIPIFVIFEYQQFTETLYGHGLFFDAVGYAAAIGNPWYGLLAGLSFLGGSVASILFVTPLLWTWRQLLIGVALLAVLVVGLGLVFFEKPALLDSAFAQFPGTATLLEIIQYAVFTGAGLSLAALGWSDLWNRRDAGSLLLVLWVGGIFLFATVLNWTLNVRSLLPLVPAAGILIARGLDRRLGPAPLTLPSVPGARGREKGEGGRICTGEWRLLSSLLIPAGVLALLVTWADYQLAGSARQAAADIVLASANCPGTLWFQGHWGFQYYMEAAGARPVDVQDFKGRPRDLIVYPANNTNLNANIPAAPRALWKQLDTLACPWLASFDPSVGASFYASIWGPLPFAFGKVQPTRYVVFELMPASTAKSMP